MRRLVAANGAEIGRADTKAAVLLAFLATLLATFFAMTRAAHAPAAGAGWDALWWSAVGTALLAIGCFVGALLPRRRGGRHPDEAVPRYFADIPARIEDHRLVRAFTRRNERQEAALATSLRRTSEIVRAKYLWIEIGTVLLLAALPQFAVCLQPR